MTVIDPRAHMNDTILKAMEMVDFTARAADSGVRATVLIFPIDEISDMDDIASTVGSTRSRGRLGARKKQGQDAAHPHVRRQ